MSWHNESRRHSLASKGIKTSRKRKTELRSLKDSDRDGIPDYRDCAPFDPSKQDTRLNEELYTIVQQLPFYVTNKNFAETNKNTYLYDMNSDSGAKSSEYYLYRFPTKESKEKAPEAHYKLMAMLKKYPYLIGSIVRNTPKMIVFTSNLEDPGLATLEWEDYEDIQEKFGVHSKYDDIIIFREPDVITDSSIRKAEIQVISEYGNEDPEFLEERYFSRVDTMPFAEQPPNVQELQKRAAAARTLRHEVKHEEQQRTLGSGEKARQDEMYDYEHRPYEVEARMTSMKEYKNLKEKREPIL